MSHPIATEYEYEPVKGLPEVLPEGERIIWQGSPKSQTFARHVMKTRWLVGYFAALILWAAIAALYDGHGTGSILFSVAVLAILGAVLIGLCELYAWGVQKTTVYTITNQRIVMRIGVALSLTLNIPFRQVAAVNRVEFADGTGTLTVQLKTEQQFSWLVLWPHARPWHISRPEPALRCLAEIDEATQALLAHLPKHAAATHAQNADEARTGTTHPELAAG